MIWATTRIDAIAPISASISFVRKDSPRRFIYNFASTRTLPDSGT